MYYAINIFQRFSNHILNYASSKFVFDFGNQNLARTYVLPYLSTAYLILQTLSYIPQWDQIFFVVMLEVHSFAIKLEISQNIGKL